MRSLFIFTALVEFGAGLALLCFPADQAMGGFVDKKTQRAARTVGANSMAHLVAEFVKIPSVKRIPASEFSRIRQHDRRRALWCRSDDGV
jgi:hypothetical protein